MFSCTRMLSSEVDIFYRIEYCIHASCWCNQAIFRPCCPVSPVFRLPQPTAKPRKLVSKHSFHRTSTCVFYTKLSFWDTTAQCIEHKNKTHCMPGEQLFFKIASCSSFMNVCMFILSTCMMHVCTRLHVFQQKHSA